MIGRVVEIGEKTCKHVEVRVYQFLGVSDVQDVYLFGKKELAEFAKEIAKECATICMEEGSPHKIMEYFGD